VIHRRPRPAPGPFAAAAILLAGTLAEAGPRLHLAPGLARERHVGRRVGWRGREDDVAGWEAVPDPGTELVPLVRKTGDERQLRILDRRGKTLGTVTAPEGWTPAATDDGVVLVRTRCTARWSPRAALPLLRRHAPPRGAGADARLLQSRIMRGGRFVTVSVSGQTDRELDDLAYDATGAELWRHVVTGYPAPEALLTADGRRLVVLERDVGARASTVTVLETGHRPKEHRLPMVAQLVADPARRASRPSANASWR